MNALLQDRSMGFSGLIGVARQDITPPVGIYARQWGAAVHDLAEGIHRPLLMTVVSFQEEPDQPPLILAAMDGFMFRSPEDEYAIRKAVLDQAGIGPERVILNVSHTHASCSISSIDSDQPGGELIAPYLEKIRQAACEATADALKLAEPSVLEWARGSCDLACNRDLPDPDRQRWICGYNPRGAADRTLLAGRITRDKSGEVAGIIINYACHPTTLAWDNRLISPDYVGAMREVVEERTRAPVAFLQGASGELAPRRQYTGDTAIADANGRELGFSILSLLDSMLPARTTLAYSGVQESGAPLALWELHPAEAPSDLRASMNTASLPLRPQPSEQDILQEMERCEDRTIRERLYRKWARIRHLGSGSGASVPCWVWKVGDAVFVAHPNEAYSGLQRDLRQRFSPRPVVVMNLANGASGSYLYPSDLAGREIYQAWVSPFRPEALSLLTNACAEQINSLIPKTGRVDSI